jgi:enoyl-[acyl-carrier protein] reductase I
LATDLERAPAPTATGLLAGKRILVTGLLTDRSLAYHAAATMQEQGADVVLTSFGRAKRITERAAQTLPKAADVLELDVSKDADYDALVEDLGSRWDAVDGVLHSVAFAPPELFKTPFLHADHEQIDSAMRISAYSLQRLAAALLPLMARTGNGASIVGLTVEERVRVHPYAWMSVAKQTLNAVARQLAVHVADHDVRVNMVAAGPVRTNAGSVIPEFSEMEETYQRAPLGWDSRDHTAIAGPATFLMSDLSRKMTGTVMYVDGGMHILI